MSFDCKTCGKQFSVPEATLAKYPTWTPQHCLVCRKATRAATTTPGKTVRPRTGSIKPRSSVTRDRDLSLEEVLATFTDGPKTGVFTDGAAHPNPGAGGWGAVYVVDDQIVGQAYGAEDSTTNNRMELTALIAGYELVPPGQSTTVLTDSRLCVDTINTWAEGWKKNGWRRKSGPIKNLDLVQQLFECAKDRPEIQLRWIKAHSGNRWNEFADALASAYRRDVL